MGRAIEVSDGGKLPSEMLGELFHLFAHRDATRLTPEEFRQLNNMKEKPAVTFFYKNSGRISRPVPLFCLPPVGKEVPSNPFHPPLRVSLVSMRHSRMDHIVDLAWIGIQNLLGENDFWEKEQDCSRMTEMQLQELVAVGVRHIHLYHTGYPAAMIGFYRALIVYQRDHPDIPITVTAYDFDRDSNSYRKGSIWN